MSSRTSASSAPRLHARGLITAVVASIATAVQVLWASPDALSAADWSASPLPYLLPLCAFAMLMTLAWLALLPRRLGPVVQVRVVVLSLVAYWLLVDAHEFLVRVAAWSTFETASIALHVLRLSALPITVCAAVVYVVIARLLVGRPATTS